MQDDIKFVDDFNEQLQRVMDSIPPDAEFVWVGFHRFAAGKKVLAWNLATQTIESNDYYHKDVNSYIAQCKTNTNPCSTAYVLTKLGAKNYIEHATKNGFPRATDWSLNDYLRAKNIDYCSKLVLCTGISEFGSDIF